MAKGFTLVELIGVIAIAGILAAVAAPRFFSASTFESRGYFDAASGFLRYAQKLAIARHGNVTVLVNAGDVPDVSGLTLCRVTTTPCPEEYLVQALVKDGVRLAGTVASFTFNSQGSPGSTSITLTITGDQPRPLTVEAETGYVH